MHKMFRLVMFCLGLPCLLGTPARAQQTLGSINGTVTDVSGGVLGKVTVKVHSASTNLEQTAVTKDDGSFLIVGLPIGKYSITFFARWIQIGDSLGNISSRRGHRNRQRIVAARRSHHAGHGFFYSFAEPNRYHEWIYAQPGSDRRHASGDRQLYAVGAAESRSERGLSHRLWHERRLGQSEHLCQRPAGHQ